MGWMSENYAAQERGRVERARKFAQKWAGRGYEKGDTHSFWLELLRDVVGMEDVTTNVRFEASTSERGFIDVAIPDAKTIVEQKSLGVSLDKPELRQGVLVTPFEQAKRYVDSLRNSQRADTIIVCDFDYFRIHDLDIEQPGEHYTQFRLAELPEQLHMLDFLVDPQRARQAREERVSLEAGALIGRLYELLRAQYVAPDSPASRHSLNVLCVRMVFCLFAEDAGLFPKNAFYRYLKGMPATQVRGAMKELFAHLRAKPEDRDPYASAQLKEFPYVNGGLFEVDVEIPNFTEEILDVLLEEISNGTNWAEISPTVFGGVFESTLNPETRRSGGMHYTSPKNIHRVIDPLFLNDLTAELDAILINPKLGERARRNALNRYHDKLASLTFFDPACGSGNFLTETYISLRRLENKVLSELMNHQGVFGLTSEDSPLKVSLAQLHGIEINDFAVNVAATALWIAELQANAEAQTIVYQVIEDLPLKDAAHVVLGNALEMDWTEVVPATECDYIIGNPPFIGYSNLDETQKADRLRVFGKSGGVLDYVACWYKMAGDYMKGTPIQAALVSTNSICQGQQVQPLWQPLFEQGLHINFAHRTFVWASESSDVVHVHVIIVGFGYHEAPTKRLFEHRGDDITEREVSHINAYLVEAPDAFVTKTTKPLSPALPPVVYGSKPADGGHLILDTVEERDRAFSDPYARPYVRQYLGARELIQGIGRWCLWMVDLEESAYRQSKFLQERVHAVKSFREASPKAATRELAATPHLFAEVRRIDGNFVCIPRHFSSRRKYATVGYFEQAAVSGDANFVASDPDGFVFALISSRLFMAWQRAVGGEIKSDLRFSNTVVWNNLALPAMNEGQWAAIAQCGKTVLNARSLYPEATLADLYDPDNEFIYPELTKAHKALDAAVERAYGLEPGCPENEIVAHLFHLYSAATAKG